MKTNVNRKRFSAAAALVALCLVALAAPTPAQAQPCAEVFEQLYPEGPDPQVRHILNHQDGEITYGLEAEFAIKKAPGILEWYRVNTIPEEQWLAMSTDERMSKVNGKGYGMVKTSRAPDWVLDKLSSDPGGAEIITKPTNSLETAFKWIKQVEDLAGGTGPGGRSKAFYWQGNIAHKRGNAGEYTRKQRDGIMGYVKITADLAQFGKLVNGYKHHKNKSSFIPGANLNHGVLGPMNTTKEAEIKKELDAASRGEKNNSHTHYLQGTYYRTWAYGEGRNGMETRDPHKEVGVLKRELRRMTHGLQKGFDAYKPFKQVKVLDETADFAKLSEPVRQMLGRIQRKKPDGTTQSISNFKGRYALPMRDYESFYPAALGLSGDKASAFKNKVRTARGEYVTTLERIAGDQSLDNFAKRDRIHIAMGKFAADSGIYQAIDSHLATKVIGR